MVCHMEKMQYSTRTHGCILEEAAGDLISADSQEWVTAFVELKKCLATIRFCYSQ